MARQYGIVDSSNVTTHYIPSTDERNEIFYYIFGP